MRRSLFALLLFFSLFATTQLIGAQDGPAPTVEIGGIGAENFPELTILVNVWDQFSVPVPSLTAEDFRVLIAGNEVPVLSAENITENELPISVVRTPPSR